MKTPISPASILSGSASASHRAATLFVSRLNAIAGRALILALGCSIAAISPAFARTTTTTTLAVTSEGSAVTTVTWGSVVTLTATVKAGTTPVSPGQVNFCDANATYCEDIHILGAAQLTKAGTATYKFRPGIGSHNYKAVYVGTNNDAASTSGTAALTVTHTGLDPTVTAMPQSGNYTLTATVGGNGSTTPTGTVSFLDAGNGNAVLGTATLGTGATGLSLLNLWSPFPGSSYVADIVVGDFNGDGILDLAVAKDVIVNSYAPVVTVLLGNGDGTFTPTATIALAGSGNISAIAEGDFNGDGILDLAVEMSGTEILLGDGKGNFTATGQSLPGTYGAVNIAVADLNGDGILDLAIPSGFNGPGTLILLGNGDGTFTPGANIPNGYDWVPAIAEGDFNGDGIPDLALVDFDTSTVTVLLGKGDGTFTANVSSRGTIVNGPYAIVAADFNGDGIPDLAIENAWGGNLTILRGIGDGTFAATASRPATGGGDGAIAVGDFNGDGNADLANLNGDWTVTVLLGNGDATFSQISPSPSMGGQSGGINDGGQIVAGDFNGDGKTGLVAYANYEGELSDWNTNIASVLLAETNAAATAAIPLPMASMALGEHQVVASYSGDGNYAASVSITKPVAVTPFLPTFSPASGEYQTLQTVSISDTTPGAVIYYTLDGSTPTTGSSRYSTALTIGHTTTVNAIAALDGYNSLVASASYSFKVAALTFSLPSGEYLAPQSLTISDATPGATIYYTTDGSAPSSNATAYSGAIAIDKNITIRATAMLSGFWSSPHVTAEYGIKTAVPTLSLAGGEYFTPQSLTISAAAGATIYYTTDGSAPTAGSTPYTSAIAINNNMTIRAIAVIPGNANSSYASAQYAIKTPAPVISPGTGIYTSPQQVTISDSMAGAAIYYTTDGSKPTTGSTPYTGMITVSGKEKIRAIAAAAGYADSPLVYADYGIK